MCVCTFNSGLGVGTKLSGLDVLAPDERAHTIPGHRRVPAVQNGLLSRKLVFRMSCRFSGCKAVFLRALQRRREGRKTSRSGKRGETLAQSWYSWLRGSVGFSVLVTLHYGSVEVTQIFT